MKRQHVTWLCAFAVALVFFFAGAQKAVAPGDFALAVYRYHLLPGIAVNPVAIILPWVELATASALLSRRYRDAGAVLAFAMLVGFTLAIGISLTRGLDISCGCFSGSADGARIGWQNIARNVALLAACAWIIWGDRLLHAKETTS